MYSKPQFNSFPFIRYEQKTGKLQLLKDKKPKPLAAQVLSLISGHKIVGIHTFSYYAGLSHWVE